MTHEPAPGESARPVHWRSYSGADGPQAWGQLSPLYAACERETRQSPIDIVDADADRHERPLRLSSESVSVKIAHHEHVHDIIDNGHTIQVTVDEGSLLHTEHGDYELQQLHFHTPSEHTLDGRRLPMEVHFVHRSPEGHIAVVAALVEEGQPNPYLAPLLQNLPARGETFHVPDARIDLAVHLADRLEAYGYVGSLTTPPCTEGVDWLVLRDPVQASEQQLGVLAGRLGRNNRPVQARHADDLHRGVLTGAWMD